MKRILTIAVATTTLVALAGCGGDLKPSGAKATLPPGVSIPDFTIPDISIPDISIPDISIPDFSIPDLSIPDFSIPDLSIPSDLSLPGNLTEECQAIAMQFATIFAQAFAPQGDPNFDQVFGDMSSKVPADLQDDVAVLSKAFGDYADVIAASGGDMTNPDVAAALEALNTPEVQAASANLQTYFDATCPS
jgi:hypothetical protein